jgi:hypothetical protein
VLELDLALESESFDASSPLPPLSLLSGDRSEMSVNVISSPMSLGALVLFKSFSTMALPLTVIDA